MNETVKAGSFAPITSLKSLADALHRLRFLPRLGTKSPQPNCTIYYFTVP
jgi:hypothetical protein